MDGLLTPLLLIVAGFIPSLVWLIYYLQKDYHPEPKVMIAKTMGLGIMVAPLAVMGQLLFIRIINHFVPHYQHSNSINFFIWAAFVEEYVKYLGVKFYALHNPEFDEPTDAMIYMISASLGFAAIENILVLFQTFPTGLQAAGQVWLLRFGGATLLHAVSSALLGYFLGLAWFYREHSKKLIGFGLAAATLSHFAFNFSLLSADSQPLGFLFSSLALLGLVILSSFLFHRIRQRMLVPSLNNWN